MSLMRRWTRLPRALAVLALWLGAIFLSEAHHFTVRHVVCPEHGEIIDAPAESVDAAADAPDEIAAAPSADAFDGPHACDTPPLGPTLPAFHAGLVGPGPLPAEVPGLEASVASPAVSALRFAPKTSPPRA